MRGLYNLYGSLPACCHARLELEGVTCCHRERAESQCRGVCSRFVPSGPVKAISLWQPWASFIMALLKDYETRGWNTKHRGLLAIHAAKKSVPLEEALALSPVAPWYFERALQTLWPKELPTGCILGTVNLVDTFPAEEISVSLPSRELLLGDFTPGRHAWKLEDVFHFPEPVPIAGKQGLWNWGGW